MFNKRVAFYWMLNELTESTPLGVIYQEWVRHHNGRSPIEFLDYFGHLIQVYPSGPQKIQELVTVHKSICQQAFL